MQKILKCIMLLFLPTLLIFGIYLHSWANEEDYAGDYYKGEKLYGYCVTCHTRDPAFAGMSVEHLKEKMEYFKAGKLNGPLFEKKNEIFADMSDENILDLALYLSEM